MVAFIQGLCAPPFLFSGRTPCVVGGEICSGCGSGFLRAGTVTPERWSRGRGREKGVWHARLSPRLAPPPPFCGCLASARGRLRRRGRGVARLRLPPAVTLLGGGEALGPSPLGWPCGGRGRLHPHFSAFPNCGRWEGARRAGESEAAQFQRRQWALRLLRSGPREGSCWEPSFNFVCKGPGLIRGALGSLVYNITR